jgi:hypothetical protein
MANTLEIKAVTLPKTAKSSEISTFLFVAKAGLELAILWCPPPKWGDYRWAPLHPASTS